MKSRIWSPVAGAGTASPASRLAASALALAALCGLLLALASSASAAARRLWQRCDGGAEDIACNLPRGIGVSPLDGHLYVADQGNGPHRE